MKIFSRTRQISAAWPPRTFQTLLVVLVLAWAASGATAYVLLGREEFTPAKASTVPETFPPHSQLILASDRPTLLLFAHPHCPCTRASLHEFAAILRRAGDEVSATIVFVRPPGVAANWELGELYEAARALPGVTVFVDEGGAEADRFGVRGSGHVALYRIDGRLAFSGGITDSRGHEGASVGDASILGILAGHPTDASLSPVYGCPLLR